MLTPLKLLTVDQAVELLRVSRRGVIDLIVKGTLTWTMAADKKTVLVEMPADLDKVDREIRASGQSRHVASRQSPIGVAGANKTTTREGRESSVISDIEAWSQPK